MAAAVSQSASPEELACHRQELAALSQLAIPLARWLAVGTAVLVTAIVISRRLAGGLRGPVSPVARVTVTAAGVCLVQLVDWLGLRAGSLSGRHIAWLTWGCLLLTLATVGLFWTHSLHAVVTTLLMLAATIGLASRSSWRPQLPCTGLRLPRWQPPARRTAPSPPADLATAVSVPLRPPALAGQLVQWQERYLLADGQEQLRGQLVVTLAADSRLATGHIGFCPALPAVPDVSVTTDYDALEVVVDAAEVLPWGIRVECRVEDPADEPVAIPIDLHISLPATAGQAFSDPPPQTD